MLLLTRVSVPAKELALGVLDLSSSVPVCIIDPALPPLARLKCASVALDKASEPCCVYIWSAQALSSFLFEYRASCTIIMHDV